MEEVKNALTGFTEGRNANKEIADYVNWYISNTEEMDDYKTDLQKV